LAARYWKRLAGSWRRIYVSAVVLALYLNFFVLLVQLFQKTPGLLAVAPTQSAPAFIVTQVIVLVLFAGLGWSAVSGCRTERLLKVA
jgi:hypothetical protein